MFKRIRPVILHPLLAIPLLLSGIGCKSASITEIRGKTSAGPEFRNFGNNTQDVRYTVIQGFEAKLSNDWTAGVSYQRRDLDEGAGDNENLVLFEIGYPLWKTPKKSGKTAHEIQIRDLEKELRALGTELAAAEQPASADPPRRLVQTANIHGNP